MPNCNQIDPLVTPYVDDELPAADRALVTEHVRVCAPCHSRVTAEQAVRTLIQARKTAFTAINAPESLREKCADLAWLKPRAPLSSAVDAARGALAGPRGAVDAAQGFSRASADDGRRFSGAALWRTRLAPVALAASLVLVVGGAFVYQITDKSSRVMVAELTADHVKCLALNRMLDTHDAPLAVESSMLASFGWQAHLPEEPGRADLELVGARPCLYGEGKIAHIMYRHQGRPVSLFMLPNARRSRELVEVLGHQAAIWCVGDRTFVLIAREPKREVEQIASFVQASLR
jgi:anti-sigma factor RsiW